MSLIEFKIYEASVVILCMATGWMGVFVLMQDWRNRVYRLYAFYTLMICWWSACRTMHMLSGWPDTTIDYLWITHVFGTLIPCAFVHFVAAYSKFDMNKWVNTLVRASYVVAYFVIVYTALDTLTKPYRIQSHYLYFVTPGLSYIVMQVFFALLAFIGCYCLYLASKRCSDKNQQFALRLVCASSCIGFIGGMSNFLLMYDIRPAIIFPYGNCLIIVYVVVVGYVMLNKQFLSFGKQVSHVFKFMSIGVCIYGLTGIIAYSLYVLLDKEINFIQVNALSLLLIMFLLRPFEYALTSVSSRLCFKGTIDQISSQKEHLESELERSERLKSVGILAAGMAHEIRNPIQSLKTFGEYLDKKYDDESYRSKFQELISKETNRIEKLTTDLLEFSKPKEPNRQRTDLLQIITEVLELLSNDLMKQGVTCDIRAPKEAVYATVDSDQIKQALINLILNAKDAMQDSITKELTITLENKTIFIQDTGCGIAPDKIPHLFDPFYTSKEKGTGLGLAITHSILERNKAGIQVISKYNHGTKFIITFN